MDREQLNLNEIISGLENFRQACISEGCIIPDDKNAFEFEEAFPGAVPTPFIVNVNVTNEWLDGKYNVNALNFLIDLLYQKTDSKTLESILTLRICTPNERTYYDTLPDRKTRESV